MKHHTIHRRTAVKLILAGLVGGTIAGAAIALAAPSSADPGCETIPWGFLGSQRRDICDGPLRPDGSWMRARVIRTPAHQTQTSCYGFSAGSLYNMSCSPSQFVPEQINDRQLYPVTPDTVLPDEPGYLGNALAGSYTSAGTGTVA